MLVKLSSKDDNKVHLWNYEAFKEHHNAVTKSYNLSGNRIDYIIYEVNRPIDDEFVNSLGLKYEVQR